jgi:hypothetical protein
MKKNGTSMCGSAAMGMAHARDGAGDHHHQHDQQGGAGAGDGRVDYPDHDGPITALRLG